jgi:glycosyltransferase involved in cell wall biosynthesis
MHLIAKALHKKLNIPWVADFRDPWTDVFYFDSLKLSKCSVKKHKKLENQVITQADKVVAVSWHGADDMKKLGAKNVDVITNGYDEECVQMTSQIVDNKQFTVSYTGVLLPNESFVIWDVFKELCDENIDFAKALKINLIGHIDTSVKKYISDKGLSEKVSNVEYMQHSQVLDYQRKSDLLLLLIPRAKKAECILTGKLFEYLAAGRPVLSVGPVDGDAAKVLSETRCGASADYDDKARMKEIILHYFNERTDNQSIIGNREEVAKYSRRNLTKDYVTLLNDITR